MSGGSSPGGLLSQGQQSLADFTWGEGEVGNAFNFGNTGTSMSTMEAMGSTGPDFGRALNLQKMSQADTQAQNAVTQAQNQQTQQKVSTAGNLLGGFF